MHLQAALDELVDRAGALVNLRTAISRYRKPRRRFRFFRSGSNVLPRDAGLSVQLRCSGITRIVTNISFPLLVQSDWYGAGL